ncbi:preprotein translocase subunit YajC [Oscillospiraceae bacterium MB08-C2-2]|nr:preprotein translocase subunit YajC [Oscillospiraceae bacterium MB08-C2-2]
MLNTILAAGATGEAGTMGMITQLIGIGAIFAVFYFIMIRPQKKREKEIQEMRSRLDVGDEIITSGGIIGRVVSIKEDTILIETGSDRSKIRIARWAIQANNTAMEAREKEKKEKKEKKEAKE